MSGRSRHRPRASYEELEIRTEDGASLRAVVEDPPADVAFRGTCVLAHSLFARKTSFGRRERPGLAHAYAQEGFRTIAFDFRGHGESTLAGGQEDWAYDDLVRIDLPAVVDCARARSEDSPVLVLGHSLGGHVALASQGAGRLGADGIIAVAASAWTRAFEPSLARWTAKQAIARVAREAVARTGRLSARRFRLGSDDASAGFVRDFLGGTWQSADGGLDYAALLANVRIPVCAVASDGDRVICHPDSAAAFARRCSGPVEVMRIARSDDGSRPPGHMAMVTGDRARSVLLAALRWTLAQARP